MQLSNPKYLTLTTGINLSMLVPLGGGRNAFIVTTPDHALAAAFEENPKWGKRDRIERCLTGLAQAHPEGAVVIVTYVVCSLLAVVAGVYLASRVASGDPTMGATFGLESVTAVALGGVQLTGGIGSIFGVVTGALSLGLITNGINQFGISPFLRGTVTGLLLLAAVCAQRRNTVGL